MTCYYMSSSYINIVYLPISLNKWAPTGTIFSGQSSVILQNRSFGIDWQQQGRADFFHPSLAYILWFCL